MCLSQVSAYDDGGEGIAGFRGYPVRAVPVRPYVDSRAVLWTGAKLATLYTANERLFLPSCLVN
jgi:hypothetical protein